MPLKFGKTGVPVKTYTIQKTGFPFYDACQVVGAMHFFFGCSAQKIQDHRTHWTLQGAQTSGIQDQEVALNRERLLYKGLERVEQTTLVFVDDLQTQKATIEEFSLQTFPKNTAKLKFQGISRFLEPSMLTGLKGPDGAKYGSMASQMGVSSERPLAEMALATIGLTRAAIAYGNDEVYTILPVLNSTLYPMTPFMTHQQKHQHAGGVGIASVMAALNALVELGQKYQIDDFAFAYHGGRGFYYGGLLGLHKVCQKISGLKHFPEQVLRCLQHTNREDVGLPVDLARLLADFIKNPAVNTLAKVASIKARLMVDKDLKRWVMGSITDLLGSQEAIQEAFSMTEKHQHIPAPSEALIKALGTIFRSEDQGQWIGSYILLERAQRAGDFYAEISKIISRALARAEKSETQKWLAPVLKNALFAMQASEVLEACEPANKIHFQAHKTTFLLRVLASIKYQGKDTATSTPSEGDEQ